MKCPNCGSIIPDDSEFCQHCGKDIPKPRVSKESTNKTSIALKITTVCAIILAIVMLFLFLGSLDRIKTLESEVKKDDNKISELNGQYKTIKEEYDALSTLYDSLKEDYDDLGQQYDDLDDEYWYYRSDGQALQKSDLE